MPTKIEWCRNPDGTPGEVWNPTVGCTKVSEGCRHCYAERMASRLAGIQAGKMGAVYNGDIVYGGKWTGNVKCLPWKLDEPLRWKKPRVVFVDSMSDLFHPEVPDAFIAGVWGRMIAAQQHKFILLTKRPERMANLVPNLFRDSMTGDVFVVPNVWLGVSVSNQDDADKFIPWLLKTPAAVRLVSVEPMLGAVDLRQSLLAGWHKFDPKLHWVICGGESGPGARPLHPDWVRNLRDQCLVAGVPFFFKQWGEWYPNPYQGNKTDFGCYPYNKDFDMIRLGKKLAGNMIDGQVWEQRP